MQSDEEQFYSREEIEKILSRALEKKSSNGEISHGQLVEIARELGLSEDDLVQSLQAKNKDGGGARSLTPERSDSTRSSHCEILNAQNRFGLTTAAKSFYRISLPTSVSMRC